MSDIELIVLNLFYIENTTIDDIQSILNNKYSTDNIQDMIESFSKNNSSC